MTDSEPGGAELDCDPAAPQDASFLAIACSSGVPAEEAKKLLDALHALGLYVVSDGGSTASTSQPTGARTSTARREEGERAAEILRTAGQRKISRLWEYTQSSIALLVTAVVLALCGFSIVRQTAQAAAAFQLLQSLWILVLATYFQRTNHHRVGGVALGDIGR